VEHKRDLVILLDSITRLARAYNTIVPPSGKVLSGGVDSNALKRPKRFCGGAAERQTGRRKEGDGEVYEESLGIRAFRVFRARMRQSWPPSRAAGVARNGKDEGTLERRGLDVQSMLAGMARRKSWSVPTSLWTNHGQVQSPDHTG
jgi:hypothetical protein